MMPDERISDSGIWLDLGGSYIGNTKNGRPFAIVHHTKTLALMPEAVASAMERAERLEREALQLRQWIGRVPESERRYRQP